MNGLMTVTGYVVGVFLGVVLVYVVARLASMAIFKSYCETFNVNGGGSNENRYCQFRSRGIVL